jgi:hypothetical protein
MAPSARSEAGAARAAVLGMLALLAALAAWPVVRAGYPTLGDGLIHYYRLVEFDHLLRQGVWFPRWAPDLGYGYGLPVFNYYPPLTYYVGALLHAWGLSFAHSLLGVYALAWALAVSGGYALGRAVWGTRAAGLLAAAAYGLAPYLYFNALARGALPETLGLGLLPWVLWGFERMKDESGRMTVAALVLSAILLATLCLTHLLTAVLAVPLAILFAIALTRRPVSHAESAHSNAQSRMGTLIPPIAACLLGLGLAAYFTLPAVLETGYIQVAQLTLPADLNFRNNFLSLTDLLAWPRPFDPRLVFHAVPPSLSLAALGLAVWGLAGRWRGAAAAPWAMEAALWGALAVCAAFTLPLTGWAWEALPLAAVAQFPWRLAGPASLLLAVLAGGALAARPATAALTREGFALSPAWPPPPAPPPRPSEGRKGGVPWRSGEPPAKKLPLLAPQAPVRERGADIFPSLKRLGLPISLAALWVFSLTWTFAPDYEPPPALGTPAGLAQYERVTGQLGTTSTGEFVPVSVRELPPAEGLAAAYSQASIIPRLNHPPAGVTVRSQAATVRSATAEISADAPATIVFDLIYFPGWRATVDGQNTSITPTDPHGLISVGVPAGEHSVAVSFGPTPLRATAAALSLLAVVAVLVLGLGVRGWRLRMRGLGMGAPAERGWRRHAVLILLTLIGLGVVRAAAIDGRESVFARTRFDGAAVRGVDAPLDVNFEDQLVLLGYDARGLSLPADGRLALTLYWRAQNAPVVDYSTTVQVHDAAGNIWGQADSQHPGRQPASRWRTDQYARDEHSISVLPGAPPGEYGLFVGVYQVDGPALSVLDDARAPRGQLYRLGTLTVTPGARRLTRPPDVEAAPSHTLGPLALWLAGLGAEQAAPGEEAALTIYWQARGAARPDVRARLELVGPNGETLSVMEAAPAHTGYATSAWRAGEVVRGVYRLRVPANAPAGPATVRVSVVDAGGVVVGGPVAVAALDLSAPARTFAAPEMGRRVDTLLGGGVTLLGYSPAPDGSAITLYWQTTRLLDVSYAGFVHALGVDGNLLAQADQVPAQGRRPTPGWLPGEIVADEYVLKLTDAAALRVGLYDPKTGERLGEISLPWP